MLKFKLFVARINPMDKVLLVFDDYSSMVQLEKAIRKLGFDVIGISNDVSLADQVVTFNPDSIVIYGKGQKVSSVRAAQKLREMLRWQGKVLLILQQGQKVQPEDLSSMRMDLVLEAPFENEKVIQILARFGGHDEGALLERYSHQRQVAQAEEKTETKKSDFMLITESEEGSSHSFRLKKEDETALNKKSRFKIPPSATGDSIPSGEKTSKSKEVANPGSPSDPTSSNSESKWSLRKTEPPTHRQIQESKSNDSDSKGKFVGGSLSHDESRFVSGSKTSKEDNQFVSGATASKEDKRIVSGAEKSQDENRLASGALSSKEDSRRVSGAATQEEKSSHHAKAYESSENESTETVSGDLFSEEELKKIKSAANDIEELKRLAQLKVLEEEARRVTSIGESEEEPLSVTSKEGFTEDPATPVEGAPVKASSSSRFVISSENPEELASQEQRILKKDHLHEEEVPREFTRVHEDLNQEPQSLRRRVEKYSKFLKGLSLNPQSSLHRKATRAVQNDLMLNINVSEIEDQDELRRDFTRHLFKKKR